jgi:hypothetical protein
MVLQAFETDGPVRIQIHHFGNREVEDVGWDWKERQKEVAVLGRDVMESLFAFADGEDEGVGWVSLEDAARFDELVRGLLG